MIPYIKSSTALQYERLSYDPVSLKRMRINKYSCQMRTKTDGNGSALFELFCDGTAVMAFLFTGLRAWELNQRRDAFARLFRTEQLDGNLIYFNLLPTEVVAALPDYPMWKIDSPLGESGFWASDELRISTRSSGKKKTTVSVLLMGGLEVAHFVIDGMECDDEAALDAALSLRTLLHIKQQIRVESRMDHNTIVWYIPSKINQEVRHDR